MDFEELGHCTCEPLSVDVRLAYAALLAHQGHPAMVMPVDQLMHRRHARWQDARTPMVDIRAD